MAESLLLLSCILFIVGRHANLPAVDGIIPLSWPYISPFLIGIDKIPLFARWCDNGLQWQYNWRSASICTQTKECGVGNRHLIIVTVHIFNRLVYLCKPLNERRPIGGNSSDFKRGSRVLPWAMEPKLLHRYCAAYSVKYPVVRKIWRRRCVRKLCRLSFTP